MYTLIREDYDIYTDVAFGDKTVLCVADELYKIENYCTTNFKFTEYDLKCLRDYRSVDDVFDSDNIVCDLLIEEVEVL